MSHKGFIIPLLLFIIAYLGLGVFTVFNQNTNQGLIFGAPTSRLERTLLPETTSLYWLGSTSNIWNRLYANYASTTAISATTVCVGTDCRTAWPAGTGTVTSVALTTPTGLTITGSPITTSGTLALTLTSGYDFWTNTLFDNRLSATTTLPNLTKLLGLTNASTTQLTTTGSTYLATLGGNVGIGTTSPTYKLQVMGTFSIQGSGGLFSFWTPTANAIYGTITENSGGRLDFGTEGSPGGVVFSGTSAYASAFGTQSATSLHFATFSTTRVTIDSTGKVGIGTTNPGYKLEVSGDSYITGNSTTTKSFYVGASNLVVKESGNVGIGTTTPGTLLSIGNTGTGPINLSATATSTYGYGINVINGCFAVNGTCVGGGTGLTSLGPTGQLQTGSTQTFATSSDTNIGLTITSAGDVHTFTSNWIGTLAAARIGTLDGFTDASSIAGGDRFPFYQDTSGANRDISWTNLMGEITNTGTLIDLTVTGQTVLGYASTTGISASYASSTNAFFGALTVGNSLTLPANSVSNASLANSTISGVALGSNLAALTNDATLNGSSYNGSGAISDWGLNLGNANSWTALQTFGNATATQLTATTLYFPANSVEEVDISFITSCGTGNHLYVSSGNLACENAAQGITAGRSLTWTTTTIDADAELYTRGWTHLLNSTTTGTIIATSTGLSAFQVPVASTITGSYGYCDGAATTTVTAQIRANAEIAGSEIFNTAFAIGDQSATTTFANTAIAAQSWVVVDVDGNGSGVPQRCKLSFKITVND